ncbi:lasso peptide biosynthesis B2 protein [Brevundimonas sp.]|jgi:hypothetical protein|uniref:lasso peptide biosynthesis B2 protein n=1 Tax=Brevundimonas sp. TaxID=1871086 RepID=UPI003A8E1EBA
MARQVTLAAGLHMVRIRDDVVILDVGADRYSCLVGGGNQLTPVGSGAVSADDDVLQELQSAGLIAPDPGAPACRTPVTPQGELTADEYPGRIACLDTAIRTLAATAAFRGQSLAQLVDAAEPRSSRPTPFDCRRISARVSAYRTVLPFIPFEGLCLQRAYQLRRILASDGQRVDWVFGVKTWPFFAHCWLQIDDLVIGDRFDRVRSFTPIAVF